MKKSTLKIISGTSHPSLASSVAKKLGVTLTPIHVTRFANGEIYAKPDETVRGSDVFVFQTSTHKVNEDLMELFVILDALKRSFARTIHVVIPHYGYSRQDRVAEPREPISAKLVADLISTAGADHVITMKLHSDQEQGFFNFPVDNLNTNSLFADYFKKKKIKDLVVISPDAGGAKDAKKFADILGAKLAIIHKNRPSHNKAEISHLVGDVSGKTCVLYDDMIDTAGSVVSAVKALKKMKANKNIYLAATHAVFSSPASIRLAKAGLKEVVVSDSIPIAKDKRFKGLKVLTVAPFLASIIKAIHEARSVTQASRNVQ